MTLVCQHEIEIEGVVPGPQCILLEGTVDGATLNIDLKAPVLLERLGMGLEEFRRRVWDGESQPELEECLRDLLAYYYHLALDEGLELHG